MIKIQDETIIIEKPDIAIIGRKPESIELLLYDDKITFKCFEEGSDDTTVKIDISFAEFVAIYEYVHHYL